MKQLDLGCGTNIRTDAGYESFGVDIVDVGLPNVKVADLTFDKIPYPDNTFDLVTAYDFLEHIPMVVYEGKNKRNAMIRLFDEIYRVLKHQGVFYSQTPLYPHREVFQDPTHVSVWTTETVNYFSGDYFGFHDHYNHHSRFEKIESKEEGSHLVMRLKAIKDLAEGAPYVLSY